MLPYLHYPPIEFVSLAGLVTLWLVGAVMLTLRPPANRKPTTTPAARPSPSRRPGQPRPTRTVWRPAEASLPAQSGERRLTPDMQWQRASAIVERALAETASINRLNAEASQVLDSAEQMLDRLFEEFPAIRALTCATADLRPPVAAALPAVSEPVRVAA